VAIAGVALSHTITTDAPSTFTATTSVPAGLTLDTATGVLSGIPRSAGSFSITIRAARTANAASFTDQNLTLTVSPPTLAIAALVSGQLTRTAGTAYTIPVTIPAGFTVDSSSMIPAIPGVTFSAGNLLISSTAAPFAKGTTSQAVTLTLHRTSGLGGSTVSASLAFNLRLIAPAPTALTAAGPFEVNVGEDYSLQLATDVSTICPNQNISIVGTLPSGLINNSAGFRKTGSITGRNTSTTLPWEFPVNLVADTSTFYEGGGTLTVPVIFRLRNLNPPVITSGSTRFARVGKAFVTYAITATSNPSQFEALGLPQGLTLTGNNVNGTPTQVGNFTVTLRAYNSYRPGSTNPADLQVGIGTLSISVMAKNESSYAFDGNLNNSLGESSLSGENLVYTTDRRGNSGKAVRPGGVNGLSRSSSVPEITSDATVAFWFKMPEIEIPATGWWLFSSGSLGVKLLPDPAGTKVQVVGLESRWGVPLADQFTKTLSTWSDGSGWHHLCIRLCDSNWPEGARVFYDGAELGYLPAYNEYIGTLDLNNFCLGSKTGSADGSFFPGEFDDFALYDEPLGIYEPFESSYPQYDHYANPTISELYLGLASLSENHAFFGFDVYGTPWPDQYNIDPYGSAYNAVEFESLFGGVALQDNGDLSLLDSYTGNTFRYDPGDPNMFDPIYSRKTCDPRMLYENVQAVSGPAHLIVLKKNGDVVEQKWGGYYNEPGNVTTRHTGCVAVAAGFNVGMALGADGLVRVWHPFPEGTQQDLSALIFEPGRPLEYGQASIPVTARNCVAIAAGEEHCLALTAEGRVVAWGNNDLGQTSVPASVLTGVVKIAAGPYSSIALKKDGTVITWGDSKTDSQNPPAEWQGHFQDIVARSGMMGGVTDLGRPILWRHGSEGVITDQDGLVNILISDGFVGALRAALPNHVSRLHMGFLNPHFAVGHLISYEAKTAVPFWKVQIPQKVAVPEQSTLRLDLREFLTTSAIPNLRFEAIGLPEGSSMDSATGTLVISNPPASARALQILARNDQGLDRWTFILQSGAQGLGLQPLPVIESMSPIKLAELMVPTGWSSPTPLDPSRYEVRVVGDRTEIWSIGELDYENLGDRSLMVTISALDLAGGVQTATSAIILGNNSSEDVDRDGLLEIYEQFYGTSDLLADSDGDLFPDLYEIQHGTSPSQASANPRVAPISLQRSLTGSSFSLEFLAPFGKRVYLESSMDLKVWSDFPLEGEILSSPVPGMEGDGKMHQLTVPIVEPRMFFRTSCEDLGSTLPQ
jgi:hypothetical protein